MWEFDDLNEHSDRAVAGKIAAAALDATTGVLSLIPTFHLKASFGVLTGHKSWRRRPTGQRRQGCQFRIAILAQIDEKQGQNAVKKATYEHRADDLILQSNLAAYELMHIGRQILGSLIAEQFTYHEYQNMQKLIANSLEVEKFLQGKFSNEELYTWMQGEISRLYYEYYRFAFDTARKAEKP